MQDWVFPKDERELTPELLTGVLSVDRPDVAGLLSSPTHRVPAPWNWRRTSSPRRLKS